VATQSTIGGTVPGTVHFKRRTPTTCQSALILTQTSRSIPGLSIAASGLVTPQ